MLKYIALALSALALTACATAPGQPAPTAAELADKVCPPLQAALVVLVHADDATLKPEVKAQIAALQPYIVTACAAGASFTDLHDLADNGLPLALKVVDALPLSENQRNTAVLAIAVAQAAISAAR